MLFLAMSAFLLFGTQPRESNLELHVEALQRFKSYGFKKARLQKFNLGV